MPGPCSFECGRQAVRHVTFSDGGRLVEQLDTCDRHGLAMAGERMAVRTGRPVKDLLERHGGNTAKIAEYRRAIRDVRLEQGGWPLRDRKDEGRSIARDTLERDFGPEL
jgi:hypothetical protein